MSNALLELAPKSGVLASSLPDCSKDYRFLLSTMIADPGTEPVSRTPLAWAHVFFTTSDTWEAPRAEEF